MRAGVEERKRIVDAGVDIEDERLSELGHEVNLPAVWEPALFLLRCGGHTAGTIDRPSTNLRISLKRGPAIVSRL